jgi:hypothetical protein
VVTKSASRPIVTKGVIRLPHFSTSFRSLAGLKRHCFSLLFAMAPHAGFEPATEISNVMGARSCLYFSIALVDQHFLQDIEND